MNKTQNDSQKLLALHKPKGYLVTRSDDLGRKTVYDLLPDWALDEGWMPIGRLDLASKGLLLFTTDGQIGNTLTKPGACAKVYDLGQRSCHRGAYRRSQKRCGEQARATQSPCR